MKSIFVFLSLAFLINAAVPYSFAQCDAGKFAENCIPKLEDGFTFLKSFNVDGQAGAKDKVEYSYVFSKDTQYFINICVPGNEPTDGIIATLFDSNRKMVATNFANGKFYDKIKYPCSATGIYYITFTFKDSQASCGGSVLGFKR